MALDEINAEPTTAFNPNPPEIKQMPTTKKTVPIMDIYIDTNKIDLSDYNYGDRIELKLIGTLTNAGDDITGDTRLTVEDYSCAPAPNLDLTKLIAKKVVTNL